MTTDGSSPCSGSGPPRAARRAGRSVDEPDGSIGQPVEETAPVGRSSQQLAVAHRCLHRSDGIVAASRWRSLVRVMA